MIFLLFSAFFITTTKPLTIKQSKLFRGSEETSKSSVFIKYPRAANHEDITSNLTRQTRTGFQINFTKHNGSEIVADRQTIFELSEF
ncbi:hypothetical protein KIN20_005297 [Parelaphostrongylus tenuis]|uniref:Uncharacterized protein n=1 Tax=Parelaphostrongylus tenuis TaxID=148309 RepID=A0AAD5M4B4_PARTN|nr:hypothetical protein KIN20_005297 [Parelaphostrongylus tenuis]